jgi:Pyruvate/2-oxoacid:ferredoxin oxidoreductase gamma subunit
MQSDGMLWSGEKAAALRGVLSAFLDLPEENWLAAIRGNPPEKLHDMNLNAFHKGREAAARWRR